MQNDFVEGMEILLNCKRYVENRIDYLTRAMERADENGKEYIFLQREITRCRNILKI